jgi:hypothetical protein
MSRPKKDPLIKILTRPDHIFEDAYPYEEGAIKQYAVLLMYQEKVNTRALDPLDPAKVRANAFYFEHMDDAYKAQARAVREHGSRLFFSSVYYLRMGINAAFWEKL